VTPLQTLSGALEADLECGSDLKAFARDVQSGLFSNPKRLSCRYFYDAEGSLLFERICRLPEYYPTEAEKMALEEHSSEIAALYPAPPTVVELGSGSSYKTRVLLDSILSRHGSARYVPIDISPSILRQTARDLTARYSGLRVTPLIGEYEDGLGRLEKEPGTGRLFLWLGSSIGNLDRAEASRFLLRLRAGLTPTDRLLIGIDLRKDPDVIEAAYNDSLGVTSLFNLNILSRINRELRGGFDTNTFRHQAIYEDAQGRVRMYLVSMREQSVPIVDLGVEIPFRAGEAIHTEDSYKYSPAEINALATNADLVLSRHWLDSGGRFSLNLFSRR